jgi:hypothetical protein
MGQDGNSIELQLVFDDQKAWQPLVASSDLWHSTSIAKASRSKECLWYSAGLATSRSEQ